MRVLFVGDIVGSPGRQIVHDRLADIVAQRQIDLVIANGENSASGFGITPRLAEELLKMGIDVLTGGNHSWDRKEILEYLPHEPRLLRPANFPEGNPGRGLYAGTAKNGVKMVRNDLGGSDLLTRVGKHVEPTTSPDMPLNAFIDGLKTTLNVDGKIKVDPNPPTE